MDGHLRYYIDGSANPKNWMKFVRCARHVAEQNLVLVQQEYSLYYEATRVITEGVELKVWYGDGYMVFMGIPLGLKIEQEGESHATCGQESLILKFNSPTIIPMFKVHLTPKYFFRLNKSLHLLETHCALLN